MSMRDASSSKCPRAVRALIYHKYILVQCPHSRRSARKRTVSSTRDEMTKCLDLRANMAPMKPQNLPFKAGRWILLAVCLIFAIGATPVPGQLTDQQFWSLSKDSSEDDGFFRSDNLLSN